MSDTRIDLPCIAAYLTAAGYRPLPQDSWPPGALGLYVNDEGDAVALVHDQLRGLELHPAGPATALGTST